MSARRETPRAGLYLRLSEKDRGEDQSGSIDNQRRLLTQEAQRRGIRVEEVYVDDGFTGTNFRRPGFERMIADIERGRIDTVMTKDLSRLGRNYAQAGYYQEEYFPSRGVRYLAVLDGYDSENEFSTAAAPWMNVANEQYARDASRKIRGALRAKMEAGQFVGAFAPYGYAKDPRDKNRLTPDPDSAKVVRRIFRQLARGALPGEVARALNDQGVPSPLAYRALRLGRAAPESRWTASGVAKISRNRAYVGDVVHNRQSKASYKSRAVRQNAPQAWIVNENAHEPLVSRQTFQAVQALRTGRRPQRATGFSNLFSGYAFCADCQSAMSASPTRAWREGVYNLCCGAYKQGGNRRCTHHFIRYDRLCALVYAQIASAAGLPAQGELSRALLETHVERIWVHSGGCVEVRLRRARETALPWPCPHA